MLIDDKIRFRRGITGNFYIYSTDKISLEQICRNIGKSPSSVYFNRKYNGWVVKIKDVKHKRAWLRYQKSHVGE